MKVKIGTRTIAFSESITTMSFSDFKNYWNSTGHADRTGKDAEHAAKKLKIKVPNENEGGE